MKIVIDIPLTQEELEKEREDQIEEFRKLGLLPYTDDSEVNADEDGN